MKNISRNTLKAFSAVALAAMLSTTAHAQLVSYTISDQNSGGGNSIAPTIADATTTTATDYTLGSGLKDEGLLGFGVVPKSSSYFATSLAGAEAANAYVTFTVAPTAGNELNLTSVDLSGARFYNNGNDTTYAALESSVTGFGTQTAAGVGGTFNISGFLNNGPDVTLNPTTYADLTSPVVFRLYVYATDGKNTAASLPYDAETRTGGGPILINGTVSQEVPEPGTYALMGFGLAALLVTMRTRRSSNL
jgi:hypothetical protein